MIDQTYNTESTVFEIFFNAVVGEDDVGRKESSYLIEVFDVDSRNRRTISVDEASYSAIADRLLRRNGMSPHYQHNNCSTILI